MIVLISNYERVIISMITSKKLAKVNPKIMPAPASGGEPARVTKSPEKLANLGVITEKFNKILCTIPGIDVF